MYTEQDRTDIRQRVVKYSVILAVILAALIAVYVMCMIVRIQWLAMIDAVVMFAAACFMWCVFLYPCIRYMGFLKDMQTGLAREIRGSVVDVSEKEDLQDGVRVLPVRIFLHDEQDERIVYLNASKADGFPEAGTEVRLNCFGRHIKEVAAV